MSNFGIQTRKRKVLEPKRFLSYEKLPDNSDDEDGKKLHVQKKKKSRIVKNIVDIAEDAAHEEGTTEGGRKKYVSDAYACSYCSKVFRSNATLFRHQRSHSGHKPFVCDICRQGFSSSVSLKEHIARHENKMLYECNVCSKKFRQNSSFHRHLALHSDKSRFECNICNRRFALQEYLRSHMIMHSCIKKHKCDECVKSFAHLSDLKRHKIIHTGKRPYKCNICDMNFADQSSRRRHVREHDKVKPQKYSCNHCSSSFTRPNLLKNHLTKAHANDLSQPVTNSEGPHTEKTTNSTYCATTSIVHAEDTNSLENPTIQPKSFLPCIDVGSDFQSIPSTNQSKLLPQQNNDTEFDYLVPPPSYSGTLAQSPTMSIRGPNTVTSEFVAPSISERLYSTIDQNQKPVNFDLQPSEVHFNSIDYVSLPDFNSQEYYSWLSDFTSLCKLLTFPIEFELFSKISQVYKSIVDALSEPSGILCNKNNFRVLRNLSQDLFLVKNEHLNFIFEHLSD